MIKDLYRQGVSISELARRSGHDRKTIRRIVRAPLLRPRQPRGPRGSKLDPFKPYLLQRIGIGVLNAHKLCAEVQAQGYSGQEGLVRAFVRQHRPARTAAATLRFETAPGEQAQVDWGHFGTILVAGVQRRLYAFVMTLGWSRCLYLEFTTSLDMAWWLRGHLHAFAYFGGVPRQVLHDNLKSAVLGRQPDGTVQWNPRYLDFAHTVGFTPRACAPYRAQTKGKVENGISYVRKNFWPGLCFLDLADLNQQALHWLNTTANQRLHGTTGEIPFARLAAERLPPLRETPAYDTSLITFRRSSRDCLISFEGNVYSVPAAYVQQTLQVNVTEGGEVVVLTPAGQEIARHTLVGGHRQRVIEPAHYQGLPAKPTLVRGQAQQILPALHPAAPEVEVRSLAVYDELLEVAA